MSHAESSSPSLSPVAPSTSSHAATARRVDSGHGGAESARAFLIQLVSREIQLAQLRASWLRTAGRRLAAVDALDHAAECVRLATETWKQREQLVVLLHRLVARWNRGALRRVEPLDLTEQPVTEGMRALIELSERALDSAAPWSVLEIFAAVERLLSETVPFALELACANVHDDLDEAAAFFRARAGRAAALRELVVELAAMESGPRESLTAIAEEAIASLTTINLENAELGRQLAIWRMS